MITERTDLSTTYEEADVIIVQKAYQFILDVGIKSIGVICDKLDNFVLLVFFLSKIRLTSQCFRASNRW